MLDSPGRRLIPLEIPFETVDVPPVRGRIKSRPEDFIVDEEHAYPLCGEGEHLYVRVEKKGWSMERLLSYLREALDVGQAEIGYAGLKDKHAITRQWFSVPRRCEEHLPRVDNGAVRVLDTSAHTNKLKTGHLRGNRFCILLRGTSPDCLETVTEVTSRLARDGMLNIFGNQRFGQDLEAARVGRDVVAGAMKISAMSRMKRKFTVSAIQSYLFNLYVNERMSRGELRTVLAGDVVKKRDTGGIFIVDDVAQARARYANGELVITGPIFGRKMTRALQDAGRLEIETLAALQMNEQSFDGFHSIGSGTRRTLLAFPEEMEVDTCSLGVRLRFFLPKGCYATVLLREILKRDV